MASTPRRAPVHALIALAVLAAPPFAAAAVLRVGAEFQVNTYTPDYQFYSSVAADADGDFVVVWSSRYQDGEAYGVFGQRFDSAGTPLGSELAVSTYFSNTQHKPAVAAAPNGDFVVIWQSYLQDGAGYGVFAQRYSSDGSRQGAEFQVNDDVVFHEYAAAVAADAEGDFVVVWQSNGGDDSYAGVFARRYDSAGVAQAVEFQVNAYTFHSQSRPAVGAAPNGDFVVAWESSSQDDNDYGVFARRFSSAGVGQAAEFQVNTYTSGNQSYSAVGVGEDGSFVVAWRSYEQDGSDFGVFAQRFSAAGVPEGIEFQANVHTIDFERNPTVAVLDDGSFVIGWNSEAQDFGGIGVFARLFDSAGNPGGPEFQVHSYITSTQSYPAIADAGDGRFVFTWGSRVQDDGSSGVFARRYLASPLETLDADGNGALDTLTDGLLILRYLFGFTDTALTSGAVAGDCGQCTGDVIVPYLDGVRFVLDIDGDNSVAALTDGLLVVRHLFGFTGTALTTGAVGVNCFRCDAATIEPYLGQLD